MSGGILERGGRVAHGRIPPYARLAERLRRKVADESVGAGGFVGNEVGIARESGLNQ